MLGTRCFFPSTAGVAVFTRDAELPKDAGYDGKLEISGIKFPKSGRFILKIQIVRS